MNLSWGWHSKNAASHARNSTSPPKVCSANSGAKHCIGTNTPCPVGQAVNDVSVSLATSLKKLQLSYVDLYLIHSPYFANEGTDAARLQEAWAGMEKLKAEGLAKSIGVSNWLPQHTEAVMATAKVPPAINQIEFHAYLPRKSVVEANKKHGIATSAYGPLVPLTKGHPGPVDEFVQALAKKYAVTESEILLRWVMEQDVVAITASRKEQRLSDYLRVARFKLTPEEVRRIGELGEEKHFRAFWGKKFAEDDRT